MAVFARVVDEGSFRAVAKELSLAPSRVSETVSDLEQYLGVTLLYRTTRKLSLTSEGRKFYVHVAQLLRSAEAGLNELNALSQEHIGELKIALPAFLATSNIATTIAEFAREHPKVTLELSYSDQIVDMINEGFDMSIRVGKLEDSSMMSRKIGESRRLLVAGKEYLETRATPKHPSDLNEWDWIHFRMRSNIVKFESPTGEIISNSVNSRISVNNVEAMLHLVNQNIGVSVLPEHLAGKYIKSGKLVHLLPEWELSSLGYYAVWPDSSRRENLTLQLVRYLADYIKTNK